MTLSCHILKRRLFCVLRINQSAQDQKQNTKKASFIITDEGDIACLDDRSEQIKKWLLYIFWKWRQNFQNY